jgi:transcriptional regulator with XRE-family HTH domain
MELCCLFATQLKSLKPKPMGYPNEPNSLGQYIRKIRLDRGLQIGEVAAQIGVTASMVSLWEMNRSQPTVGFAQKVRPAQKGRGLHIKSFTDAWLEIAAFGHQKVAGQMPHTVQLMFFSSTARESNFRWVSIIYMEPLPAGARIGSQGLLQNPLFRMQFSPFAGREAGKQPAGISPETASVPARHFRGSYSCSSATSTQTETASSTSP